MTIYMDKKETSQCFFKQKTKIQILRNRELEKEGIKYKG